MACKVEGSKGTMCPIPAGKFKMGSKGSYPAGQPVREVCLSAFGMQKHHVTVGQYRTYVKDVGDFLERANALLHGVIKGKHEGPVVPITLPSMPNLPDGFGGDKQPMVMVRWQEARDYCRFYGMDLPTDAQWERAARGRDGKKDYGTKSGGLNHEEAVYSQRSMAPVCSKPENDFELCDMAGNAWQWTLGFSAGDVCKKTTQTREPKGLFRHEYEGPMIRGGCWGDYEDFASHSLRATNRFHGLLNSPNRGVGFRCVVPLQDSKK